MMPPVQGSFDGVELEDLDPADEDDRRMLLLAEHPELQEAIENDEHEIELDGRRMSPQLHLVMHEVVANRIWEDDPAEMWVTAQRLTAAGYDRHEVLHMLGSVVSADLYGALKNEKAFDISWTRRELAALPGSWEALRTPAPANRAVRPAHAKGRRH